MGREWAWWNVWRIGAGREKRGHQPPETWTSRNVNNTRGANGPGSPKKNKKSKQKKHRNGENHKSYDKGYSCFKPSTWFGSSSADSASKSSSRGIMNPGSNSSNDPSSSRNVNMNNQPPNSSPSKNNGAAYDARSTPAPGGWDSGSGGAWRMGAGGTAPNAKNSDPREDIVLTDVSKRQRKNDKDRTNPNTNADSSRDMDPGDQQRESKMGEFFSMFRSSKDKGKNKNTDSQRPLQQPYAQNQAANSSRSRIVDNRQGLGPRDGVVDGRTGGRLGPGFVGQGRDPSPSPSKGTKPMALDSTKFGDKNVPPQKKEVTSPLSRNPVPSSAGRDGRIAERSRGPALIKNNTNSTNNKKNMHPDTNIDMNDPNAPPNMRGRINNTAPDTRQAPGAANVNHTRDGERNLGFQRPRMAQRGQSPPRNVAAGYRVPDDTRNPGKPSEVERDAKKTDRKGTGLDGIVCAPFHIPILWRITSLTFLRIVLRAARPFLLTRMANVKSLCRKKLLRRASLWPDPDMGFSPT